MPEGGAQARKDPPAIPGEHLAGCKPLYGFLDVLPGHPGELGEVFCTHPVLSEMEPVGEPKDC